MLSACPFQLNTRGWKPTDCSELSRQESTIAEPVILALDTSSKATSIAVARGAQLISSMGAPADEKRSERLWSEVRSLLAEVEMTVGNVDVFSACVGPGAFTGLRVGMAAVKGLATASDKPVVGVTSLEAAAFSAGPAGYVCALVNSYKGEVYSQLFSFDGEGVPVAQNDPMVSTFENALERVTHLDQVVFAGDAAEAGAEVISRTAAARGERKWVIKQSEHSLAEDVARLAFLKYKRGELESAAALKACYVRPAEAEIKLSLGLLGSKIKRSMKGE